MKYCIIGYIPNEYSDIIEEFDTLEEARKHFKQITSPNCLDPWHEDFSAMGGHIRIEDENGSGY